MRDKLLIFLDNMEGKIFYTVSYILLAQYPIIW